MKKNGLLMILLFSLIAVSCSENTTSSGSDDSGSDGGDVSIDGGGTGTDGGGGTGTTGGSCLADGSGSGHPIITVPLEAAGHQSWMPGTYSDPIATSAMPTIRHAGYIFRSDGRLKLKFKVNNQPTPVTGEEYCYGRQTGQPADAYRYTKLKFKVSQRDIICNNSDPSDPANCSSGFYLGGRYQTRTIGPISVNSCSSVIDLSNSRNNTIHGTVVEVYDVRSDSDCQFGYSEYNCPSEKIVRKGSCWNVDVQVVTDQSQDF